MNKRNLLVALVSFGLMQQVYAAELVDLSLTDTKNLKTRSVRDLKQELPVLLGTTADEQLKERSQAFDLGATHVRYYQTFRGVQIWPQELAVSVKNGRYNTLNGTLVRNLQNDIKSTQPQFSSARALELGKNLFQGSFKSIQKNKWHFESQTSDLRIYVDPKTQVGRLVYIVSFFADIEKGGQPHRPIQIIDAHTGELIETIQNLNTAKARGPGGNIKTGQYQYGKQFPEFEVTQNGTDCIMQTATSTTIDLKNWTWGTTPYSFKCSENKEKIVNGAYGPLNDAHFFAGVISGLYKDWYNTAPLKIPIQMRVHYATDYENAFWNGSSMTFGDGKKLFYPLVSLDVSAHEIAHGFTEFNSGLIYREQSGGINEAFSDMAGEAAEYYAKGKNDFNIGADIFKKAGAALRYMKNPSKDGKSIDHVAIYTKTMDVHYSSGIYNRVFYVLATKPGWTTRKAFDVFVKANQNYWTPTTTFASGAVGARDAAKDLGYNTADVVAAFSVVGIKVQ